ncbi:MAG: hypothetical protein RIC24_06225 [Hyphomicrobiales bacterium]|jgi:hypothetical protein
MRWLIVALMIFVGALHMVAPSVTYAQVLTVPEPDWCLHQGESVWEARRPAQNALARITIDLRCVDDVVSGVRVKAETRCGRALCTWSFAEEAGVDGPTLNAVFFTFTATRLMRLMLTGNQVNVEVLNNYNQPGRTSDTMSGQFTLAE